MDDMITKSKTSGQHINDLLKLFERLQKYRFKLNPTKCTFRVRTRKLLGFIVNKRGINWIWIKSRPSRTCQPQRLKRKVNYIARFISQLIATCSMIFKLLWKNKKMEWNQEGQEAFDKFKQYLESPPILIPTIPDKPLILYLTELKESMGGIVGQQDDFGKEQAIYYLKKKSWNANRGT
ncbi:Tf2-9, partial [Mucuna pruriens]